MADGPTQALVFIANEAYAIGLAAALASVKKYTSPVPLVFIVDGGLGETSKERLRQVVNAVTVCFAQTPALAFSKFGRRRAVQGGLQVALH